MKESITERNKSDSNSLPRFRVHKVTNYPLTEWELGGNWLGKPGDYPERKRDALLLTADGMPCSVLVHDGPLVQFMMTGATSKAAMAFHRKFGHTPAQELLFHHILLNSKNDEVLARAHVGNGPKMIGRLLVTGMVKSILPRKGDNGELLLSFKLNPKIQQAKPKIRISKAPALLLNSLKPRA